MPLRASLYEENCPALPRQNHPASFFTLQLYEACLTGMFSYKTFCSIDIIMFYEINNLQTKVDEKI